MRRAHRCTGTARSRRGMHNTSAQLKQIAKHQIAAGRRLLAQLHRRFGGVRRGGSGRSVVGKLGDKLNGLHEGGDEMVQMLAALFAQFLSDGRVDGWTGGVGNVG